MQANPVDFNNPSPAFLRKLDQTILNQEWRMLNLYKIQTKEQKLENFRLNPIQRVIHSKTEGLNRIMHLKSRQVGISTYWLIRELDDVLWTPHTTCAVLAHDRDTIELLFEIVSRAYNYIPQVNIGGTPWVKPVADRSNTRMLKFDELDSKIYVDLSVRGGTVHKMHISEAAFIKNMSQVWAASQESVPVHGGRIVCETTANGKGNWFHNEWVTDNTWHKLFFAWFDNPENALDVAKDGPMWKYSKEVVSRSLTQEEKVLMAAYNLTMEQICWFRFKLESYGEAERHLMKQENPATAEEAFIYAEGRFYPEFHRNTHVLPDHDPPPGASKYASLDYGWSNPTSIGLWYGDYDENYVRYDEGYKSFWPIPEQCAWLRAKGISKVDFCDPSIFARTQQREGKIESLADEYRRHGIILGRANNDKGAGFPRVRDYLRLRDKHKNPLTGTKPAPHVYFCERCKEAIREMETIRYARPAGGGAADQTAREDHEKTEKVSHACDEIRYFLVSRPRLPEKQQEFKPNTPGFRLNEMAKRAKVARVNY